MDGKEGRLNPAHFPRHRTAIFSYSNYDCGELFFNLMALDSSG